MCYIAYSEEAGYVILCNIIAHLIGDNINNKDWC